MFNKIFKLIKNPLYRFNILSHFGFFKNWTDEKFLKEKFKLIFGYELNLKNPQTFNEKLQWLKLYDRNPLYTIMVDKYKVKEYVANIIGKEYIIPTLGVWDNPEEIKFDKLPNQFVLKCNHNSGLGMCICKDKTKLDIKKVKKELTNGLKQDYYLTNREWPYKNVPRKIIAEQYMEDKEIKGLIDYKFFCFNGQPKFMYISNDIGMNPHTDFFDMDKNMLLFRIKDPPSLKKPTIPKQFEQMKQIAICLSKNIPHVRVDFYIVKEQIYLGELTFFHNSGFIKFTPNEWDKKIGDWLVLPKKTNETRKTFF